MDYYKFFDFLENKKGMKIPLIARLLHDPESVLDNEIENLHPYRIVQVLVKHPQLIDKFNLDKLNSFRIFQILKRRPQLIDKLNIYKLKRIHVLYIIEHYPHLKKHFKNHGLL